MIVSGHSVRPFFQRWPSSMSRTFACEHKLWSRVVCQTTALKRALGKKLIWRPSRWFHLWCSIFSFASFHSLWTWKLWLLRFEEQKMQNCAFSTVLVLLVMLCNYMFNRKTENRLSFYGTGFCGHFSPFLSAARFSWGSKLLPLLKATAAVCIWKPSIACRLNL